MIYTYRNDVANDLETHRFLLERGWDDMKPSLLAIGLNPSYADGRADDQTLAKMVKIAKRHGFGGLTVMNLFSKRSPNFKEDLRGRSLEEINDEVNNEDLRREIPVHDVIWLFWGHDGKYLNRDQFVFNLLRKHPNVKLLCIGTNKNGTPRHPGHESNNVLLRPFSITKGDFNPFWKNKKRRDYKKEVEVSMEHCKFQLMITEDDFAGFLEEWENDAYAQSQLEKAKECPDVGSALFAAAILKKVLRRNGFNIKDTPTTMTSNGHVFKSGDFKLDGKTYILKTSYRYCTTSVNTRFDMDKIDVVIGAQVVYAPEGSGYFATVYFHGYLPMSTITFDQREDRDFTVLKPADFGGHGFFSDGIISMQS